MSQSSSVWLVSIECREGESGTLGPFKTKAGAVKAVKEYVEDNYDTEAIEYLLEEFDGDLAKGLFYSEDETIEIYSRKMKA